MKWVSHGYTLIRKSENTFSLAIHVCHSMQQKYVELIFVFEQDATEANILQIRFIVTYSKYNHMPYNVSYDNRRRNKWRKL